MADSKPDARGRIQPAPGTGSRPAAGNGATDPPQLPGAASTRPAVAKPSGSATPGVSPATAATVFGDGTKNVPGDPASGVRKTVTAVPAATPPGASAGASSPYSSPAAPRLLRPIPIPRRPDALPVADDDDQEPIPAAKALIHTAPPWLISMVVHMVALLVMAMIFVVQHHKDELSLTFYKTIGDPTAFDDLEMKSEDTSTDTVEIESNLEPVTDPFSAPPKIDVTLDGLKSFAASNEPVSAPAVGVLLMGREAGMREALRNLYGGDALTDDAVNKGLAWLAKQQRKNGSWSLRGPYTLGSPFENRGAATAMALLAFQGAGNTHIRGTYKGEVDRGVKFLLGIQKANGDFFEGERRDHWLYTHGQCTIAICELYAMTRDTRLAESAQRAIKFALEAQHEQGGWRYRPREDRDTSVSGWVMMGLQSGKMAGIELPKEALERFSGYLDTAGDETGWRYGYLPGAATDEVMTAEALLCRQYLGWAQSDPRLRAGAEYLTSPENLPSMQKRDVYYWYYATQMLHHMEGSYWPKWNDAMKPILVESQVKSGPELGSWHPMQPTEDRWALFGGRLYMTCLSIYTLEVYYRHLPLYKDVNELRIERD